ncbi:MAG: hypothetical protein CMF45_04705 [Legionellales bacterium]|nr:hypothetical protein [Legionellales bacterium]
MNYKSLIALSLLLFSKLLLAEIIIKVDRDPIVIDESFHLIFESERRVDAKPDFSSLTNAFSVLDTRHRSSTQISNGKINYLQTWIATLIPNKIGTINIPSIRFGKEVSKPFSINIIARSKSNQADIIDDVFVNVEVNTNTPYVQAQLIYTVRLYIAKQIIFANASLGEIKVIDSEPVIKKLGEDRNFETQRNGKNYRVIERQFVIFPQNSGPMTIQPLIFKGQTRGATDFFSFDQSNKSVSIVKRSKAVELNVKPIPHSFTGDTWLPAKQLSIEEQWSIDPSKLKQGEATTRTLTLKASGLASSHLPEIKSELPSTLKQYPDQPEFNESSNENGYIGFRRDKVAIIPIEEGVYTLPSISIPWWNTNLDKMEIAKLPGSYIQIESNTAALPINPAVEQQKTINEGEVTDLTDNKKTNLTPTTSNRIESIWKSMSLLSLVLWLLTLIFFWRSNHSHFVDDTKDEVNLSQRKYMKKIKDACKSNDPKLTQQALLDWARLNWPDKNINNLNLLKKYSNESFKLKLDELNICLYGSLISEWDGTSFLNLFESQSYDKKKLKNSKGKLEPLYRT